jgi:hypothetical protein
MTRWFIRRNPQHREQMFLPEPGAECLHFVHAARGGCI